MDKPKVSVVMAVRDEQDMLPDCLKSVDWVDEVVIVVDSRTTDQTRAIATKAGARVFEREFSGFASQKNFAIDQAQGDWILLLDADERVTPELRQSIESWLTQTDPPAGGMIDFTSVLLGQEMHYGGWNEQHLRLFQKKLGRYSDKEVHEELVLQGPSADIAGRILHISHRDIRHILDKVDRYTSLEATDLVGQAPPVRAHKLVLRPIKFFVYYYVIQQGFRDGIRGLIECVLSRSYYQFLVYVKLWELQQQQLIHERRNT